MLFWLHVFCLFFFVFYRETNAFLFCCDFSPCAIQLVKVCPTIFDINMHSMVSWWLATMNKMIIFFNLENIWLSGLMIISGQDVLTQKYMQSWQCLIFSVWIFFFFLHRPIQSTMSLSAMPLSMTSVRRQPAFPSRLRAWMLFWQFLCSLPFIQTGGWRLQDKWDLGDFHHLPAHLYGLCLNVKFQLQTCLFNIQKWEMDGFMISCLGCITNAHIRSDSSYTSVMFVDVSF